MPLTFTETANVIAAVDGMPAALSPVLVRRIRMFDAKNLVPVIREDVGRREGRLDLVGACMARLHSELIDFGLDAETLRGLRRSLDHLDLDHGRSEFASAIELIRAGERVSLTVKLRAWGDPWQKGHSFHLEGLPESPDAARAKRAQAMLVQPTTRAVLTVDLNDLLDGFIAAFEAAS